MLLSRWIWKQLISQRVTEHCCDDINFSFCCPNGNCAYCVGWRVWVAIGVCDFDLWLLHSLDPLYCCAAMKWGWRRWTATLKWHFARSVFCREIAFTTPSKCSHNIQSFLTYVQLLRLIHQKIVENIVLPFKIKKVLKFHSIAEQFMHRTSSINRGMSHCFINRNRIFSPWIKLIQPYVCVFRKIGMHFLWW